MDPELYRRIRAGLSDISADTGIQLGYKDTVEDSVEEVSLIGQNDKVIKISPGEELTVYEGTEPYVGQEFESEAAAQAFYSAYGMRMGFITRINYANRCKYDGSVISQALVCNKEGHKKSYKLVNKVKQRAPTRVDCKAMIYIRKLSTGRWIVTWFVKEHTHALLACNNQGGLVSNQTSNEDMRVKELTQQLLVEKKRSASLRKIIDLLFSHIEEHTQELSKKIQYVVASVKEIESEGKDCQKLEDTVMLDL